MLPPHELKNKPFTKAVRGYSTTEVDEHIAFIIDKYTELYRANDEMERKLRTALAKLDAYKTDEESIRSALINAQKASATIINEATERANVIVRSAKSNCDKTLDEFRVKIKKERATLLALQKMAEDFKEKLFAEYQTHIEQIEALGTSGQAPLSEEEYVRQVVSSIKDDAAAAESQASKETETEIEIEEEAMDSAPESTPELANPDEPIESPEEDAGTLTEEEENEDESPFLSDETEAPIPEEEEREEIPEEIMEENAEESENGTEWEEELLPEEDSKMLSRTEEIAPEPENAKQMGIQFPKGGFAEELGRIDREVKGEAVFEEEEPITEEELSESDALFSEDGTPLPDASFFDEDGREYEGGKSPDYDLDHTSDTIELERVPVVGKDRYRAAAVKDTLRALSKKLNEEDENDSVEKEEETPEDEGIEDEADREFLRMIQSATSSAQKRQQTKKKQQSTRLSPTDEFNRVYGEKPKRK